MLLKYEFCKHINKFNILLAVLLLIFNIGIVTYQFKDGFTEKTKIISDEKQKLLDIYINDRAEYDKIYNDYSKRLSEYNAKYYGSFTGNQKSMVEFENVIINYPDYGDIKLFNEVKNIINAPEDYRLSLYNMLHETVIRLKETKNLDSYTYKYYLHLINNYDTLTELSWDIAPVRGWNEFFSLQTPSVFITLAVLGIFCNTFTVDKRIGFSNVLSITPKGGNEVVSSKLGYVTISSIILTTVYSISPLIIFVLSSGFSSPFKPIQALDAFKYCRFEFSILQYFFVYVGIRVVLFLCFSLAVAVIGQYVENEAPSYVFAAVLVTIGVVLKNINSESKYYHLNKFNIIDIADVNILFTKLIGLNLFNFFIDYTYFIILVLLCIIITVIIMAFFKKTSNFVNIVKNKETERILYSGMSLFMAENYKILVCEASVYIILSAVFLKLIISGVYYRPIMNPSEFLYMDYIEQLKGEVTEEKLAYIEQERNYIYNTLDQYSEMKDQYQSGRITYDDYQSYLGRYNYANFCKNSFEMLSARCDYLVHVNDSHKNIEFVYEEGVNRLLGATIDITAVITAIFICSSIFSFEYESGFYRILRLTRRGRSDLFRNKILVTVLISVAVYVLFNLIDIFFLIKYYDMDYLSANIISIPRFENFPADMSILFYVISYKIISFAGYQICFLLVAFISGIMENKVKTITVSAAVIFIPFIVQYYGISFFHFISIPYLISPENILIGLVTCAVCAAFTLIASIILYYKWNGNIRYLSNIYRKRRLGL